jgi:hypothetical protein
MNQDSNDAKDISLVGVEGGTEMVAGICLAVDEDAVDETNNIRISSLSYFDNPLEDREAENQN